MFSRKDNPSTTEDVNEWLTIIPQKNCDYMENPNGHYVLQMPKSDNAVLMKVINFFSKNPFFKIKLDDRGSFIWEHCDGKNSIGQICRMLEDEFGDSVKPTPDRTVMLFKSLYSRRLVRFFQENAS